MHVDACYRTTRQDMAALLQDVRAAAEVEIARE
jgi:hypothetical protein